MEVFHHTEQRAEKECLVNHPVKVKGALWRMDGVEVRELAKRDLSWQAEHGGHAGGSLICRAQRSQDGSNQWKALVWTLITALDRCHCADPGSARFQSSRPDWRKGGQAATDGRLIPQQDLSEYRQAHAVTVDRLGNAGLSVVMITTISILLPYHCERLKSILNFLNTHSFHWLKFHFSVSSRGYGVCTDSTQVLIGSTEKCRMTVCCLTVQCSSQYNSRLKKQVKWVRNGTSSMYDTKLETSQSILAN